jgi:hypothetical protein
VGVGSPRAARNSGDRLCRDAAAALAHRYARRVIKRSLKSVGEIGRSIVHNSGKEDGVRTMPDPKYVNVMIILTLIVFALLAFTFLNRAPA